MKKLLIFILFIISANTYAANEYIYSPGTWSVAMDKDGFFRCTLPWRVYNGSHSSINNLSTKRTATNDANFKCWQSVPQCVSPQVRDPNTFACVNPSPTPEPDPCKAKAGQSAGSQRFLISGVVDSCAASTSKLCSSIVNKDQFVRWYKDPVKYSCDGQCQLIWDNNNSMPSNGGMMTYSDKSNKNAIYAYLDALYTGSECTPSQKQDTPPASNPNAPQPDKPQSQNNCPPGTTFGTVNNVPMCVKNAPPIDPNTKQPIPSLDDGKACTANCDNWKPDVKRPPGTPDGTDGKAGTGQGVDGDGQQDLPKSGGGTADGKVDAKDEEGNDVSGDNKGFGEIKQDDIYQSKYKEKSFGSIWNDKKELLLNTGFLKGISDSFPKFSGSGSEPSFRMTTWKHGSHEFEIDPRAWLFIKACIILTACFTARKIIW